MCKEKSVRIVNGMMSLGQISRTARLLSNRNISLFMSATPAYKQLDKRPISNIIVFTDDYGRFAAVQAWLPTRAGDPESATAGRQRRDLQVQRLLRCRRSPAGQIRDAPAGRSGQSTDRSGGQRLRILAAVVLSGSSCVSGCRTRRLAAAQARPAVRPQADVRTNELRRATPGNRTAYFQFSNGGPDCRTFWDFGSPAQHRPPTPASKKTSVSAERAVSFVDSQLVTAYEELRAQAVAGWRRGPGLALMLTRGFRCWMEASRQLLSTPARSQMPNCRPAYPVAADLRNEVVIVLASMLLHRASKVIL